MHGSGSSLLWSKLEYLYRTVEDFGTRSISIGLSKNIARDFPSCGYRLRALETIEKLIL
jgi:hypothetical protein